MDRRKQKTRKAIYNAFLSLLEKKRYHNIYIQEIIDLANVGRSTFYSHFETKDALLESLCYELFDHVFKQDSSCNIPIELDNSLSFEQRAVHILHHFKTSKKDMHGILRSPDAQIFWINFSKYLRKLFEQKIEKANASNIPVDYLEDFYFNSFISCIKWWVKKGMKESPEQMIHYYMKAIHYKENL